MKSNKKILLIMSAAAFVAVGLTQSGCKPTQVLQSTTMNDSTYVEKTVVPRDTFFYTKSHFIHDTIFNPCPDATPVFKDVLNTDKKATLKATVVGKNIAIECFCDTNAIKAKLKDTYEKSY